MSGNDGQQQDPAAAHGEDGAVGSAPPQVQAHGAPAAQIDAAGLLDMIADLQLEVQRLRDERNQPRVVYKTSNSVAKPKPFKVGNDFELFLKMFENYCHGNAVEVQNRTCQLLSLLDEEAYKLYNNLGLSPSLPYDRIVTELRKKFEPIGQREEAKIQLMNCKQQEGESLEQFFDALTELVRKAGLDSTPRLETELQRDLRLG